MVKCICEPINTLINNITIVDFTNSDLSSFLEIESYTNIEVIKCYPLLFRLKGIINNIGFYIISILIFIFIIIMFIFIINYNKNISYLISIVSPKKKKKDTNIPPIKKVIQKKNKKKIKKGNKNINKKNLIIVLFIFPNH